MDIVSSGAWNQALLRHQPGVGALYLVDSRKTPYWLRPAQWRLVRALRARGVTSTWNCDGDDPTRSLLARAGVPCSYVVDAGLHACLPDEHEVDRWLRLATMTPPACEPRCAPQQRTPHLSVPPLRITDEQRLDLDAWLSAKQLHNRPLVLVQAGNKRTMKWWRTRGRETNTKYWPE